MPFCPKCRAEYREGFTFCSDCDEELIDELVPEDNEFLEEEMKDWVALVRLTSPQYAEMIEEVFEQKDIPIVILSGAGHFGRLDQMGTSSFRPVDGAYSIMVPKEYLIEADKEGEIVLGELWVQSRLVDITEY
ncbi:MAG: zinc ribbon domain-containing protein [Candidatus Zixiibacteriota bacterium]